MANIYEWLEDVDPPLRMPPNSSLEPMDGILFAGPSTDSITPLDIDVAGNMYPDAPIDPSLYSTANPLPFTTSGQSVVMVPEQLADVSSKILIYLAQVLELPEDPKASDEEETTFTAEELEALEPIDEETFEFPVPNVIDGIFVNQDPTSANINDVIDHRRIGPDRKTFYLARTTDGIYYWFHSPHTDRDHQLRRLIGSYRRRYRAEVARNMAAGN